MPCRHYQTSAGAPCRRTVPAGRSTPASRCTPSGAGAGCRRASRDTGRRGPRTTPGSPALLERLAAGPGRADRLTHLELLPPRAARTSPTGRTGPPPTVRAAYAARGVTQPVAAPGRGRRARARGPARRGRPPARRRASRWPTSCRRCRGDRAARGRRAASGAPSVLYLAPTKALAQDQLAALARARARRPGRRPTTATAPARSATGPATTRSTSSPTPTCCTARCCPATSAGRAFLARSAVRRGRRVPPLPRRLRRPRLPGAAPAAPGLRALRRPPDVRAGLGDHGRAGGHRRPAHRAADVTAVTERRLAARRGRAGAVGAAVRLLPRRERRAGPPRRQRPRPPTCSPTWSSRTSAPSRSSARAAASSRSRAPPPSCSPRSTRRWPGGSRPTAAATCPRSAARSRTQLRSGELLGLAATNALELGIDITGLDAVLMAGFPGTRAALWQQVGRAGRGAGDALGVLVARDDPLDTYLVHHPEALLGRPVEATVFDPDNPLRPRPAPVRRRPGAAADRGRPRRCSGRPRRGGASTQLTEAGLLRRRPRGWFWTDRRPAADLADIRSTGGPPVQLVEAGDRPGGRHRRRRAAPTATAHAGAVYVHRGETWLVRRARPRRAGRR